jgi:hypothetical protein
MSLNLIKLCVGASSVEDLESWIEETRLLAHRLGRPYQQIHTTRMLPKRASEIVPGGALYWVIKGFIAARQSVLKIEPFTDSDGISRCNLVLEPVVHLVIRRPCRPFQGWRYLDAKDAPPDLSTASGAELLPETMAEDLRSLGLL